MRQVKRQTLKWKKEKADKDSKCQVSSVKCQKEKQANDNILRKARIPVGVFCQAKGMCVIDQSTCIVIQTRKFEGCIGCRHYGG